MAYALHVVKLRHPTKREENTKMNVLATLRNSAQIIAQRPLSFRPGMLLAEIVCCYLPDNSVTPFVTWQRNIEDGSTYWGHYFKTESEARADFAARGK
jgi:hypothetical protein